ncbi:hypothetical protein [Streptomyces sp. NBC_01794]|uniref:hypothetical protein n=1 Tax=Streptomyces sp. NBC_01794 TaxID=2975942 RepID=UPI003089C48F|nr:hypothetical protein OIE54_14495 [Streptomyces sp. NBC_01794]
MNTFLNYLFVLALFGLITLPALVGHARERAIDRQLREAELREAEPLKAEPRRAVRRSSTSAPVPSRATVRANSGSSSRPAPTTVAVKAPCNAG